MRQYKNPHKGAQQQNKGSWGMYLAYRNLGQYAAPWSTYGDGVDGGQKGWEVGTGYTLFKNVRRHARRIGSNTLAFLTVFAFLSALLIVLVPQLIVGVTAFVDNLSAFAANASTTLPDIKLFGVDVNLVGIIATPEDMNLQAMYLLSVGQFYTYDYTPDVRYQSSGRSSVAMNSFLSGTLSQNFGKFLHEMGLNNEKWSFGTSVATGQEGWNDMDVEGLFSAKLLGGRLFIDGNLGYRDRAAYTSNLVGDFTARYLLNPAGTIQLKAYSESNDRYFTRHSLTTQGGGILFKRDFNNLKQLFKRKPRQKKTASSECMYFRICR